MLQIFDPRIHRVVINPDALRHNVKVLRGLAPASRFAAVVKSNAYGHGLIQVVQALKGQVDYFAVNSLVELQALRQVDFNTPVLVMGLNAHDISADSQGGCAPGPGDIKDLQPFELVVSSHAMLSNLRAAHPDLQYHIKIDTGLSRLGMSLLDFNTLLRSDATVLQGWTGLMTHFANVEDVTEQSYATEQLACFLEAARQADAFRKKYKLPRLIHHAAASAPLMVLPPSRLDLVRAGIALYGLWPSRETRLSLLSQAGALPELQPALRWEVDLVHVHTIPAGASIGYGCTQRVERDTRVAILPIGYYEGYDRALFGKAYVLILGQRAPLLGRVSMNMLIVDISLIEGANVGDVAILIGEKTNPVTGQIERVTADQLADWSGTINYEIVTRILPNLPRVVE